MPRAQHTCLESFLSRLSGHGPVACQGCLLTHLEARSVSHECQRGGPARGPGLRTWTWRSCTWVGRHCTWRLLQQPEQRCTSTQGGHTRKLALVRSTRRREISNTSVRVLHSAIMAGSATVVVSEGRGGFSQGRGGGLPRTHARQEGAAECLSDCSPSRMAGRCPPPSALGEVSSPGCNQPWDLGRR